MDCLGTFSNLANTHSIIPAKLRYVKSFICSVCSGSPMLVSIAYLEPRPEGKGVREIDFLPCGQSVLAVELGPFLPYKDE